MREGDYEPTEEDYAMGNRCRTVEDIEKYGTVISANICELSSRVRNSDDVIETIELWFTNPLYPAIKQYICVAVDSKNKDWKLGDKVKVIIVRDRLLLDGTHETNLTY